MKAGLCETAESVLGYETRRQPDWFRESEADLKPLLERRTRLYTLWLSTARERDRKKFAKVHSNARRAVQGAKDNWFERKALEAQRSQFGGKAVWRCVRDIQRERRELVPVRSAVVRDEEGNACTSPE